MLWLLYRDSIWGRAEIYIHPGDKRVRRRRAYLGATWEYDCVNTKAGGNMTV